MAERPLPEAIRGNWYFLPARLDPKEQPDKPLQAYGFRLDGTFTRWVVKDDAWTEKEQGEYTFDGAFLILRGRNTDTYRVRTESSWRWVLGGKKEDWALVRGRVSPEDFVALSEEDAKEIRILPIRVSVEPRYQGEEVLLELVYRKEDAAPRPIASFFIERGDDANLWIGLTPFVSGVEPRTWERIVRESYLDLHAGKPDVGVVTVRLLDSGDSRVFNYRMS